MENNNKKKCSSNKHENIDATIYCQECQAYFCNKCENFHSELFQKHHQYKLDKDLEKIFTGLCKVENHTNKLEYFCKDHLQLCCVACISTIKGKGNGQHNNCNICFIEDIKEEKKYNSEKNIKYLENLSKNLENSINKIKNIFEKMNKNKEELKIKIQKIFTKLRSALNEREDQLLLEVDETYERTYFSEQLVKKSEKLTNDIKISLENGRRINKEWNENNKLSSILNDCLDIEMNIKDINIINENLEKVKIINTDIYFTTDNIDNCDIFKNIKNFGKIICNKKIDIKKEYEMTMKELKEKEKNLKEKLEKNLKTKAKVNEKLKLIEDDYLAIQNELKKNENMKKEEEEKMKNINEKQEEERLKKEEEIKKRIENEKLEEEEMRKREEEEDLKRLEEEEEERRREEEILMKNKNVFKKNKKKKI